MILQLRRTPLVLLAIYCLVAFAARAQTYLDTIIFGNTTSESSHAFVGPVSFVITNNSVSPAPTARRCSTNNPATVNGGSLTFTLTIDPQWRNYFTVKFWGGDDASSVTGQDSDMGRLYLYVAASNFVAGAEHELPDRLPARGRLHLPQRHRLQTAAAGTIFLFHDDFAALDDARPHEFHADHSSPAGEFMIWVPAARRAAITSST